MQRTKKAPTSNSSDIKKSVSTSADHACYSRNSVSPPVPKDLMAAQCMSG